MTEPSQRSVTVLVVSADGSAVVVDEHGRLPVVIVDLHGSDTTASVAPRVLGPWLGADLPVMEVLVHEPDDGPGDAPAAPLPTLVALEPPPDGWTPNPPHRWQVVDAVPPDTHPVFAERVTRLLDERQGRVPMEPRRSPWSRPGWYRDITAWIDEALVGAGRPPASSITQIRHWGISAVLRVTSGDDVVWAKDVFPPFRNEATLTAMLHRDLPGAVAPVIAIEAERGWLLLEDVGSATFADRLDTPEPAITAMSALHHRFAGRTGEFLAAGVPDRRPALLPDAVADALSDVEAAAIHGFDDRRIGELVAWLRRSVRELDALGLPDTLVHGDFHPGNVAPRGDDVVIFDWSDAAVASPIVDVVTWQWWCDDEPCRDRTWEAFVAGWHATDRSGLATRAAFAALRPLCEGVAAAHHVVSYVGILRGLEPRRHHEASTGVAEFAARFSRAVPSSV